MKKVEVDELEQNLDFLGLKLDKLPKFIKESTVPSFSLSRLNNDKDLKVYKFVPINQIEILLTPCLRSDNIKKKYSEAMPLEAFLNENGNEEDVLRYQKFAEIVKSMSTGEIEKIEKIQENFADEPPFKVKYNRDNLWQIYYSEESGKYFMLVCLKEETFSEFLYLLKAKLAFSRTRKKVAPTIYVPINYMGMSPNFLSKSEITDIENYLWLFTKNWPLVFEVYNKKNEFSLQIVGETYVYKNVKSNYKVVLDSNEEANKFYKLLKALFILQTEIKGQYLFDTRIDSDNRLAMYLSKVEITYDSLANFVKNEFMIADCEIKNQNMIISEAQKKLANLKLEVKQKEEEYLQKQKEISTYLECKKTFIGKVKYFFKSDKKSKKVKIQEETEELEIKDIAIDTTPLKVDIGQKDFYTIEDLVTIYSLHERGEKNYKNVNQDIKALELKLENLVSKVKNANEYIEEIDKHKKSIFEFWKFANKDEKLALEMGNNRNHKKENKDIEKSFDLEADFEKLGEDADKIQRKKLSNEEMDSLFIAQTGILHLVNIIRSNQLDKVDLGAELEKLREEYSKNTLIIDSEAFDIFGNISENSKVKYIGSRSHRETEKNKFKIMNINKRIDVFDFTEKIQSIATYLDGAIPKINSFYNMNLYKIVPISKNIEKDNFEVFNIDVENELRELVNDEEGAYNLICLNYKEGMPILYYSNSIFFDNTNKTLPIGMNLSSKVLVDNQKLEFILVNKTKFRTNSYSSNNEDNGGIKSKDVFVYEYDVFLKNENSETPINEEDLLNLSDDFLITNLDQNEKHKEPYEEIEEQWQEKSEEQIKQAEKEDENFEENSYDVDNELDDELEAVEYNLEDDEEDDDDEWYDDEEDDDDDDDWYDNDEKDDELENLQDIKYNLEEDDDEKSPNAKSKEKSIFDDEDENIIKFYFDDDDENELEEERAKGFFKRNQSKDKKSGKQTKNRK